jgi:putative transposase
MSLCGINFRAHPKAEQKKVLSQWMGCARFIWNAKCEENNYLYKFKQKFLPINTKTPIDQIYAQFKNTELSPWLSDCPSQILRNTMCTWRETMGNFLKGNCGRPQKKKKAMVARFGSHLSSLNLILARAVKSVYLLVVKLIILVI